MSQIRSVPATSNQARSRGSPRCLSQRWFAGLSPPEASTLLDESLRTWLTTFRRMHRGISGIQTRSLRVVIWPAGPNGKSESRHVWEVARWSPSETGWIFICWSLDVPGLWMKRFDRLREALAYLRDEPPKVMGIRDSESSQL